MKIYIKYMVSVSCKMAVKSVLDRLNLDTIGVELGHVEMKDHLSAEQQEQLRLALLECGLELIDNKKSVLIERIKAIILETINTDEPLKINFSIYLSEKLNYDYTYMANLFSNVTAVSIENYIILQKIERVKEMLIYDELTLSEISYKLNYSSVAHLSSQFKKFTGLTPSFFKNIQLYKRQNALVNV